MPEEGATDAETIVMTIDYVLVDILHLRTHYEVRVAISMLQFRNVCHAVV